MVDREPRPSDKYLGVPYNKDASPWVLDQPGFNPYKDGINCQTFAQLYLRDEFGFPLPIGMWSKEMVEDKGEFLLPLGAREPLLRGDLLFFGKPNSGHKRLHVAVVHNVGESQDDTVIRHANKRDGVVSDWTLQEALTYPDYPVIRGRSRIVPELHDIYVRPRL